MEKQINLAGIEAYSKALAEKNVSVFFGNKESVSGKDILNFCEFKQINLFLVKLLFERWQKSMEEAKSPYFDYEHENVQKAFQQFANVLSQHIAVPAHLFSKLLEQAVYDTIILLLNPYEFYISEISKFKNEQIETAKLREIQKYILVNKIFFQELLADLLKSKDTQIARSELITSFKIVFQLNKGNAEPIEQYIDIFNQLYPMPLDTFFEEDEPVATTQISNEPLIVIPETKAEEKKEENNKQLLSESEDDEELEQKDTLNARFKQEKFTLNDKLKNKNEHIRDSISLNQRFGFINQLFSGNYTAYNQFISEVEQTNEQEALRKFEENSKSLNWDANPKEKEELLEVIKKHFLVG